MKIFISDLHLGDGSRTDDFHRDAQFLKFLDFVEEKAQELIIVGDFLELWQADLDRVLFRHNKIINRLFSLKGKVKLTYVIGNHDYIPFIKLIDAGVGISLEYRDKAYGIVAEHGHKYDIFNRYKNPLKSIKWPPGKHFTLFVASLERLIHPNVDKWSRRLTGSIEEFLQEAMHIRNRVTPSSSEYIKRGGHFVEFDSAVKNHIAEGAKIIIFGHTHKAQLENIGDCIYANCGAWTDHDEPTYLAVLEKSVELRDGISHRPIKQLPLPS